MGYLIAILLFFIGRTVFKGGDGQGGDGLLFGLIGGIIFIASIITLIVSITISIVT